MKESIADRMKTALKLRGISQAELAQKTNIGKSAISQYINGKVTPRQDNIYMIAKALDVSEGWLLGFDVDITRTPDDERTGPYIVSESSSNYFTNQTTSVKRKSNEDAWAKAMASFRVKAIEQGISAEQAEELILRGKLWDLIKLLEK